jgi:hypothetical protein
MFPASFNHIKLTLFCRRLAWLGFLFHALPCGGISTPIRLAVVRKSRQADRKKCRGKKTGKEFFHFLRLLIVRISPANNPPKPPWLVKLLNLC